MYSMCLSVPGIIPTIQCRRVSVAARTLVEWYWLLGVSLIIIVSWRCLISLRGALNHCRFSHWCLAHQIALIVWFAAMWTDLFRGLWWSILLVANERCFLVHPFCGAHAYSTVFGNIRLVLSRPLVSSVSAIVREYETVCDVFLSVTTIKLMSTLAPNVCVDIHGTVFP